MKLIANISMLFTELPLCRRLEAAARAGFDGVEIQFPYSEDLQEIRKASQQSNMPVVLINLPAGDRENGDAGIAALPDRREEFCAGLENCLIWARALQVDKVNVLAGKADGLALQEMFDVLCENLKLAGNKFAEIDVQVQLEPINPYDVPGFLVPNLSSALDVLEKSKHPNVFLQFDFYHIARTEPSLVAAIQKAGSHIGHVQFADNPGRHEPGSGKLDFAAAFSALLDIGYRGAVSAEYNPKNSTLDGLAWMANIRQLLAD